MCDSSPKGECVPAFGNVNKRGPFVREVEKRDERWSEIELLLIVGGTENREMYAYKSTAELRVANVMIGAISQAAQSCTVAEGGKAPVSACKPLCVIL